MAGARTAQATRFVAERLNADFGFYLSDQRTLAQCQSPWQHIEVFENPQFGRVMRIDGCFMTSERDEFFYHEPMVHLPAIAHAGVRRALVVGGGDGGAAKELLKLPGIEQVVLAELDGEVIAMAREWLGVPLEFRSIITFLIIIVVLLVRPAGLQGLRLRFGRGKRGE